MGIFSNTRKAKSKKLATESILNFGKISIQKESAQLETADSIAITANKRTILVLLPFGEKDEMNAIGERLMASEAFLNEVRGIYGKHVELGKVENKAINFINLRNKECTSISTKPQGKKPNSNGIKEVVALINGTGRTEIEFALRICTTNEVMKCIFPNATDLSFPRLED